MITVLWKEELRLVCVSSEHKENIFSLFVDEFQCYANKKHSHEHLHEKHFFL